MAALAVQDPTPLDPVARITAFMEGFSVEATRPSDADIAALAVLKRGGRVYLSAVPNRPAEESLSAAIRLRAAGFEPVPHIAVRNFVGMAALDDFLARLNGDAGVAHVLVVGGDRAECGPLLRALDAIVGGTLRRRGIGTIGIAGYPEGHPRIGEAELNRALVEKMAAAETTGLTVEIVTSSVSMPARSSTSSRGCARSASTTRCGSDLPDQPAGSAAALCRRCGVRMSAQALVQRSGLARQMFVIATPDDLVRALAAAPAGVTPHFFSFGGVSATARWTRAVAGGCIALKADDGFLVEAPKSRD